MQDSRTGMFLADGPLTIQRVPTVPLPVYEMPDLNYRLTAEFRGLEGQNPNSPSKDKIFKWAEFDSRWYEHVSVHEAQGASPGELCEAVMSPPGVLSLAVEGKGYTI